MNNNLMIKMHTYNKSVKIKLKEGKNSIDEGN
jgi:hypothetical protein